MVVVAMAITIFTATSSILSGLHSAPAAFAGSGDRVIYQAGAPTIFSSRVDVGIVPLLLANDEVVDAWPEVVTFSAFNGESFVVRGMDLGSLDSEGRLVIDWSVPDAQGTHRSTSVIGHSLMDRLGIQPPCALPLSGSYASRLELVAVSGSFNDGSYLDDELLVSEDVARYLCGMPVDTASLIALEADDTSWLEEALSPDDARFALFDVRASKTTAVPGETVTIAMEVRNWGAVDGDVVVRVSDGGETVCETEITLAASASEVVECQLTFDSKGVHPLEVELSGDFPCLTLINVSVVDPYLTIAAPSRAFTDTPFGLAVYDNAGCPVQDAEVTYSMGSSGGAVLTDEDGEAMITLSTVGTCSLTASFIGLTAASASVNVTDLSTYPNEFLPAIRSFTTAEEVVSETDDVACTLVVDNSGALSGTFEVAVQVDSSQWTALSIPLGPAEERSSAFSVAGLDVGTHTIQVGSFSLGVVVEPWYADEPDLVQLVLRYGGSGVLSSSASIPIYQAAKVSEGNVAVALFSVGAISALLVSLAICASFAKEVRESRRTLGVLRTLGASRMRVRRIVLPQALVYGFVGSAVGIVAGIAVSMWLTQAGAFVAFGHTLAFDVDTSLLAIVAVGAAAIAVASALASAELAVRETPMASIRDLDAADEMEQPRAEELMDYP